MGLSLFGRACQRANLPWLSLAEALAGDQSTRPIFCLFGQGLDAWSWRMADALAADDEICELIRTAFVAVWVDAEVASGPAALCQQVLALSAQASGWPAALFLLPDGRPFGAIPYAPMRDSQRRSGLATVLVQVAEAWHEERDSLSAGASAIAAQLAPLGQLPTQPQRREALIVESCEAACLEAADTLEGGFGDIPRHLHHGALSFMLHRVSAGHNACGSHLTTSLNALVAGGIHDCLGGGFHHAAQDRTWDTPFFEKRCADQAQLCSLLLDASDLLGVALYAEVALATGGWMVHNLQREDGWFAHGFHALCGDEQQPSEGGTYAWSSSGAAALVGAEGADRFARRFLSGPELADGFRVPNAKGSHHEGDHDHLPAICARLAAARQERAQPWVDQRIFSADQGMALVALARLISWCQDHDGDAQPWLKAAEQLLVPLHAVAADLASPPQVIGESGAADNLSLAWLAWGWWQMHHHLALNPEPARRWAAALWAQRRSDGALTIHPDEYALPGNQLPAVLDSAQSPSAAAVACRLWDGLAENDALWAERAQRFRADHRPLLALSPFPTCSLAASLTP